MSDCLYNASSIQDILTASSAVKTGLNIDAQGVVLGNGAEYPPYGSLGWLGKYILQAKDHAYNAYNKATSCDNAVATYSGLNTRANWARCNQVYVLGRQEAVQDGIRYAFSLGLPIASISHANYAISTTDEAYFAKPGIKVTNTLYWYYFDSGGSPVLSSFTPSFAAYESGGLIFEYSEPLIQRSSKYDFTFTYSYVYKDSSPSDSQTVLKALVQLLVLCQHTNYLQQADIQMSHSKKILDELMKELAKEEI